MPAGPGASAADEAVSCNVFVAVRARPFNSREKERKAKSCLKFYQGTSVQISAPGNESLNATRRSSAGRDAAPQGEARSFTFDKAYDMNTAQATVFNDLGVPVCNAALEGFNACIFAYGQTGSGKSFSMLGPSDAAHILAPAEPEASDASDASDDEKSGTSAPKASTPPAAVPAPSASEREAMYEMRGLIPRILENIFEDINGRLAANKEAVERTQGSANVAEREPKLEVTVTASYMEIYQEKVRCLLAPQKGTDLRVRGGPKGSGVFVEGLTKTKITSAAQALELLSKGNAERAVGSTNMNDKSSRSHAIFSFEVEQTTTTESEDGPTTTRRTATVNLVDLAGSERAKSTGAEGSRLKEGANINQSLTVLGMVISALAEQSKKAAFIPYRDSKLTWLLKENLGGNSKTFMLSALSPADINFEETLSTLRYADRAKSIVTKACVNEDVKDKVIRELRERLAKLEAAPPRSPAFEGSSPASAAPVQQSEPFLTKVQGQQAWALTPAPLGATLVLGKRPEAGNPAWRVVVGAPDDDDIADLHAELKIPEEEGPAKLRVLDPTHYDTFVGDSVDPVEADEVVDVKHGEHIAFGDSATIQYMDPRAASTRQRRSRGMSRANTARGASSSASPASQSPAASMRGHPAVPPLAIGGGGSAGSNSARPSPATTPPAAAGGPPLVPKLAFNTQPAKPTVTRGPPQTARLATATPRGAGMTPSVVAFAADGRDELVAVYHHTFVLLGDAGTGKTAFRQSLGKDWGVFERKKLPDTQPTLGFEVERRERVGTTTKCDMTMLELSGHRAFTPLTWMVPQTRSTFMIFFRLHGTPDGRRCDLHYFQPYIDLIRTTCPTKDNSVLLIGTHRDCLPDLTDQYIVDQLQATQTEINAHWAAIEPDPENRPIIRARFATSALHRSVIASTNGSGVKSAESGSLTARMFAGLSSSRGSAEAGSHIKKMTDLLTWLVSHSVARSRDDATFVHGLVPKRVLAIQERVRQKRQQGRFALKGSEYKDLAKEVDNRYAVSRDDLLLHTQLLHSWLTVFHYHRHTNLKRHVFVDVEWVFRVIRTWCCAGACAQTGAFTPVDTTATDGKSRVVMSAATEKFVRLFAHFPFDVAEVRRADALEVLHAGLLTPAAASAVFRGVMAEKRYTAREVHIALDLLAQFDLTFPATKMLQMCPQDPDDPDAETAWTTQQQLLDADLAATTRGAPPEAVYVLPGFFYHPAPDSFTLMVPEVLNVAGPTVCYTLQPTPVQFFSRLVTRLTTRFGRGVYFGPMKFWGDCAWIVASDGSRVLLRLVSRSLFVTFHDHDPVRSSEVRNARALAQGTGLTARGPGGAAAAEEQSTLDDECYEAYLAAMMEEDLSDDERELRYIAIRRGMLARRETELQAAIRQDIRDVIMEAPGMSYKERDRIPIATAADGAPRWREISTNGRVVTIPESQALFLRLRDLIQQQQAAAEAAPDAEGAAGDDEDDPQAQAAAELQAKATQLHERLLAEADADDTAVSQAFRLDVDGVLGRLTTMKFVSDEGLALMRAALEELADARERLRSVEAERFRLFLARDAAPDDEGPADAVRDKLPGLAFVQRDATTREVQAIDRFVAALATEAVPT